MVQTRTEIVVVAAAVAAAAGTGYTFCFFQVIHQTIALFMVIFIFQPPILQSEQLNDFRRFGYMQELGRVITRIIYSTANLQPNG